MVKVIAHTGSKCIYGIIRLDAKQQIVHADCKIATDYEDKEPQMKMQKSIL